VVSKGVCWHKKHNKYRARIGFREKVVELGFYNTAREAVRAYDHVAARVFGEFALTNKSLGLSNKQVTISTSIGVFGSQVFPTS
jgi:hypothetical protein